jgi:hypothetical protein
LSESRYIVTLVTAHVPFLPFVQVVGEPQSQGIVVPFTHSQPSLDWPSQFSSTPAASQTSVPGPTAPLHSVQVLVVLSLLAVQVWLPFLQIPFPSRPGCSWQSRFWPTGQAQDEVSWLSGMPLQLLSRFEVQSRGFGWQVALLVVLLPPAPAVAAPPEAMLLATTPPEEPPLPPDPVLPATGAELLLVTAVLPPGLLTPPEPDAPPAPAEPLVIATVPATPPSTLVVPPRSVVLAEAVEPASPVMLAVAVVPALPDWPPDPAVPVAPVVVLAPPAPPVPDNGASGLALLEAASGEASKEASSFLMGDPSRLEKPSDAVPLSLPVSGLQKPSWHV